jgi:preprotein translocase subunit SecG
VKLTGYFDIALIITSIALIVSLGSFAGQDTGGVFTARRGIEKTIFWITIVLSIIFVVLTMVTVILS